MKLKTRIKLAWFELALAALVLAGAVAIDLTRPRGSIGTVGVLMSVVLTIALFGSLCVASWKRLRETQTQLAELGPDAAPSADLWSAPGTPGVIGVMILVAAVAVAVIPALLYA